MMLMMRSTPHPRSMATATGGRRIASMILQTSLESASVPLGGYHRGRLNSKSVPGPHHGDEASPDSFSVYCRARQDSIHNVMSKSSFRPHYQSVGIDLYMRARHEGVNFAGHTAS